MTDLNAKKSTIFDIQRSSTVDGPGLRTTVFFKGCNLRCEWCHNPESQSKNKQIIIYKNRCTDCGMCKKKCPTGMENCNLCGTCAFYCQSEARQICGKEYSINDIMAEIRKDARFYKLSAGGVTFSGGECMLNIDYLEDVLKQCKNESIHTAVDTAGHVPYEYFERIIPYTDLFLYDLKCTSDDLHKRYTGVGSQLIMSNLQRLIECGACVTVRIPIVPTFNDTEDEIEKISLFLKSLKNCFDIELLPYHSMGEHKYFAIGKTPHIFPIPTEEKMRDIKETFSRLSGKKIV